MKTFVGLPTARRGCLMRPSCCKIHTRMRGLLTLKRQLTTVAARGGGTHRHLLLVKSNFLSQRLFSKWTWTRARTSRASSAFGFARNGEFSSRMKVAASSLANGDNGGARTSNAPFIKENGRQWKFWAAADAKELSMSVSATVTVTTCCTPKKTRRTGSCFMP